MQSDNALRNSDDGRPPLPVAKAVLAGLAAALCAAALAVGAADGAPPGSAPGRASSAGLAVAGGRGPAPVLPPISRLCFHGPRGEPVDFPAVQHCP